MIIVDLIVEGIDSDEYCIVLLKCVFWALLKYCMAW